jgi:hypothetical protein
VVSLEAEFCTIALSVKGTIISQTYLSRIGMFPMRRRWSLFCARVPVISAVQHALLSAEGKVHEALLLHRLQEVLPAHP